MYHLRRAHVADSAARGDRAIARASTAPRSESSVGSAEGVCARGGDRDPRDSHSRNGGRSTRGDARLPGEEDSCLADGSLYGRRDATRRIAEQTRDTAAAFHAAPISARSCRQRARAVNGRRHPLEPVREKRELFPRFSCQESERY